MRLINAISKKLLAVALLAAAVTIPIAPATAAVTNYPPGYDVEIITLQMSGQYTATVNPIAKFKLPYAATLLGVSANARASGGTTPTLTVDIEDDGTSVLSSAISITAGTVAEGTVSSAAIADESVIEVIFTIGGTSPTWDDITVVLTLVRH